VLSCTETGFFIFPAVKHIKILYFFRKKSRLCKLDITKKRIFAVRYEKSVIAHNKKNHILKNIQIYGFN